MASHAASLDSKAGLLLSRLVSAAALDAEMYEGVEADTHANGQAALAVLGSSVAAGIGAGGLYGLHFTTFLATTLVALITWVAWAMLMFQIGTRVLPEPGTRSTPGELLRTTGFASAPGLFQVFAMFPEMTLPVFVGTWIWMLAAMVVGVRHALDYHTTWRAIAVCGIAAGVVLGLALGFGALFGPIVR